MTAYFFLVGYRAGRGFWRLVMSDDRHSEPGTLFVVSTPLGNLEDITVRALRVLKEVDLIAAETVEHTRNLCRHYGIATKLTAFNQHNQRTKGPELVEAQ